MGKFLQISTELAVIPLSIFFKLGMRVDIVKECSGIAHGYILKKVQGYSP